MGRPACSIVIPTRDCLNYLPTTFDTIDLQHRNDLEVVLVDDGSSDGTAAWARARANKGFALQVLETGGIGPGRARNAGVDAARGKLIAFLDADDLWWPAKLDRQIAYHEAHPETGFSFTDYIHVTPDGRTLGTCFEYWRCGWTSRPSGDYFALDNAEAKLLATNLVGTSTVVADRALLQRLGGFSPACKSAEDWDLWLRLAAAAPVACSSAVTMSYLMRPGSETANRGGRLAAMRDIVARYAASADAELQRARKEAGARIDVAEAEIARASGAPATAAAAHLRALVAAPSLRTARALAADLLATLKAGARPPATAR